jgi:hypothetical protein
MLNGTFPNNSPPTSPPQPTPGLNVDLLNTFSDSATINVYISAKDNAGRVMFLTPSQAWYYPTASSNSIPQPVDSSQITIKLGPAGSTTTINLPGYFNSGRIYFARSSSLDFFTLLNDQAGVTIVQPDALNPTDSAYSSDWSFLEMTYNEEAGLFANLSFVDFISRLGLAMQLTESTGAIQAVQGTNTTGVNAVCSDLEAQAARDGQAWDKLCQNSGNATETGESSSPSVLRADSPAKYIAAIDPSAFREYWDTYVTAVWAKYATEDLLIDTQTGDYGTVACSTASGKRSRASLSKSLRCGASGSVDCHL